MLNQVIVMGRFVRDPELRTTQSGISVTSFKGKDSKDREVDFIDVVAWRNTAEFVCKHFSKGRMAIVKGSLQIREWKDRDGKNRRNAEIMAESIYFGDSKRNDAPPVQDPEGEYDGGFEEIDDSDGDLPF